MYKRIIDKLKELSKNLHKDNKFEKKEKTSSYLAALKKIRAANKIADLAKIATVLKTTMVTNVLGTSSGTATQSATVGGPSTLAISTIENLNQQKGKEKQEQQDPAQNNHRFSYLFY